MDLGLKAKVAIVTGASKGIGFAIAEGLAAEGTHLSVCARNEAILTNVASEIEKRYKVPVHVARGDVSKLEDLKTLVKKTMERFGRLDILINNAGEAPRGPAAMSEQGWQTHVEQYLFSVIRLSREVLPHMIAKKYGKIVSMSSTAGVSGMRTGGAYGAAKGGIIILTQAIAQEVADFNINVNCIAPGLGATGFHAASNFPKEYLEKFVKPALAAGKTTTPQDIGNAMAFLASDVSLKITGQCIKVSGVM